MKRIFFILTIGIVSINLLSAQQGKNNTDILWGDELKESKKSTLTDIVGFDETGFYALSTKYGGVYFANATVKIAHFNNKVKLTKEAELELKLDKKEMEFEYIVQLESELYVFSSFANKKSKKNTLYVQTLNKKTLQVNNDRRKIAEITFQNKMLKGVGRFDYSLSQDSSKIIVYYDLPYEKNDKEKFGFHVFDSKMNELWNKNIELPYTDNLFSIKSHRLDNFGNVHILGKKYYEKAKSTRKGEVNYNHVVLSYYQGEDQVKEYDLILEGKYLNEMKILVNDDKELICVGFYSNRGVSGADGCFYLKIDSETKEIVLEKFKEFDLNFITQNMTDKEEKKARKKDSKGDDIEMYSYDIDGIVLGDDGSIFMIGEQYYVREHTTTSTDSNGNVKTKTNYHYYYNDIIVVNIDFKGDIVWAEKVGKNQHTVNDNGFFSSYDLSVVGEKMYFIFNDHPENVNLKKGSDEYKTFKKGKTSVIGLVEMDKDGNQKRSALVSAKDAEVITRPKVCEQISSNQMILFGQKGKKQRFAIITFKI